MNRILYLFAFLTFSFLSCGREGVFETETEDIPVSPVTLIDLAVVGFVKDVAGNPITDAEVRIGQIIAKTDIQGLYHFEKISMSASGSVIKASKSGFDTEIIQARPANQSILQVDFTLNKSLSNIVGIIKPNNTLLKGINFTIDVNHNSLFQNNKQNEFSASLETRSASGELAPILLSAAVSPKINQDVDIIEQFELKIRNLNNTSLSKSDTILHPLKIVTKDKILYKLDHLRGIWVIEKPASGTTDFRVVQDQIYGIGNFTTRIPVKAKIINSEKIPLTNNSFQIKNPKGNILAWGITDGDGLIQARLPKDEEFYIEIKGGCTNSFQKIASGKPTGLLVDLGTLIFTGATGMQLSFKNCDASTILSRTPYVIEIKHGRSSNKYISNSPLIKGIVNLCPGNGLIEISVKNGEKLEGVFQFSEEQIKNGQLSLTDLNICGKEEIFAVIEMDKRTVKYKGSDYKILKQDASDIGITDFGDLTIIISDVKEKGVFKVSQFAYLKQPNIECKNNCTNLKAEVIRFGNVGQVMEVKITGSIDGKNISGHFKNIRFS